MTHDPEFIRAKLALDIALRKAKKMTHQMDKIHITVEKDTNGVYSASIEEMPGCFASGFNLADAVGELEWAIDSWMEASK